MKTVILNGVAAVLLCLGAALSVSAETVKAHLKNGDVISGELIEEGESVSLRHAVLGELKIPKAEVVRIERPGEKNVAGAKSPAAQNTSASQPQAKSAPKSSAPKSASNASSPKSASNKASAAKTSPEEASQTEELSQLRALAKVLRFQDWKKQLEFGMNTQRGRTDKVDMTFRYAMRRRVQKNDYRFEARNYYGEVKQEKATDRSFANFRWRHDISPGVFYETNTLYSADAIKLIDLNLEQKLGLGYRFVNEKDLKVSTGVNLNVRYREDNTKNNPNTYLTELFEDIDYHLSPRLQLTQEFRIAFPPEEHRDYEYQFEAGMVGKFSEKMHMSIRYQLEYDKSLPKARREDQRIVSSIGFDF